MSDFESVDFFTDASLVSDPYPYFDHLRQCCPVMSRPEQGVVAITGHEEAFGEVEFPQRTRAIQRRAGDVSDDLIELSATTRGGHWTRRRW